ncbi:MAG: HEPN domain-containing protein [candidate division KSB1 bacterium]|nr:HEPN domain-containing protein [candidate division KSB1 bacterium]MDZ7305211.1 HEPN domain-containing protein [candidate division KSB1 bacterium]MDZ7314322.1 HEPN domain-containing protein [candidate division KSB1 bacterium]
MKTLEMTRWVKKLQANGSTRPCMTWEMAEKNIGIEGYDVASFLAHQAVEKLLKAIFALEDKKVPWSHYIDDMTKDLNLSDETISDILSLTPDYTLSRYPDVSEDVPYEQYDEEIAQEKINTAKRIFESLKERYKPLEVDNG